MAFFLDPQLAQWGLVRVGGSLRPDRLLHGYRHGIFPWFDKGGPVCWWSPDPRAIFDLDDFHVSRRLARTIRSGKFRTTINQAFDQVIRGCSNRAEGTWLTPDMIVAYERLHHLGWAHSMEVWQGESLAGGIYGVAIGGFFAGESMYHRVRDASNVALAVLMDRLRTRGYQLFDTQMLTEHTQRLGAVEIPRQEYLGRLRTALACDCAFVSRSSSRKFEIRISALPFFSPEDPYFISFQANLFLFLAEMK